MTDQTPEGSGSFSSPGEVDDPAHFESAPRPREQRGDHGGAHLAFEATPRAPLSPVPDPAEARVLFEATPRTPLPLTPSPAEARVLNAAASVAPVDPATSPAAFEATPRVLVPSSPTAAEARVLRAAASVAPVEAPATAAGFESVPAVAQPRPTPTPAEVHPDLPGMTVVVGSGGPGWNLRDREDAERLRAGGPQPPPAWSTRSSPASGIDRSAWTVPAAPRARRRITRRTVAGGLLSVILAAILVIAVVEWATGSARAHTITTPHAVGSLAPISTPATAAVKQQMQKVMQVYGATRVVSGVYGAGGHPTLVVLLAQGAGIEATGDEFFNDFSSGLKTQGVTVDTKATVDMTADGSNFICSPATRPAPLSAVSLCGWSDGDTIGLVMDVSGQSVAATLREAEAARSAGEH